MAIYHMESKIVSRGMGRSVVAASAYMSCSRLYNDYDGVQHDYTKKLLSSFPSLKGERGGFVRTGTETTGALA